MERFNWKLKFIIPEVINNIGTDIEGFKYIFDKPHFILQYDYSRQGSVNDLYTYYNGSIKTLSDYGENNEHLRRFVHNELIIPSFVHVRQDYNYNYILYSLGNGALDLKCLDYCRNIDLRRGAVQLNTNHFRRRRVNTSNLKNFHLILAHLEFNEVN